jgi:hypothetical protein
MIAIENEFSPVTPHLSPEPFKEVKVSAVTKETGMNPILLRQYLLGINTPPRASFTGAGCVASGYTAIDSQY